MTFSQGLLLFVQRDSPKCPQADQEYRDSVCGFLIIIFALFYSRFR
jgi:hypothetical protein